MKQPEGASKKGCAEPPLSRSKDSEGLIVRLVTVLFGEQE